VLLHTLVPASESVRNLNVPRINFNAILIGPIGRAEFIVSCCACTVLIEREGARTLQPEGQSSLLALHPYRADRERRDAYLIGQLKLGRHQPCQQLV
jgi:hypothetical protein